MLRPVLVLERLTFMEPEGQVGYRHGEKGAEFEKMDYLEFIARVTSHIPDKGQVMVRYYGLYANAHRGKAKKASLSPSALRIVEEELRRLPSKGWAAMILKVYEVDPMVCPKCGSRMKVVAFLMEYAVVDRISDNLNVRGGEASAVPCLHRGRAHGGRGERGIFLGFDDQEGAGGYHLSAGARGFSVQICFSDSIFAFFVVIDVVA
jgi:hypothetical protein